jgi:hypothetical protein
MATSDCYTDPGKRSAWPANQQWETIQILIQGGFSGPTPAFGIAAYLLF